MSHIAYFRCSTADQSIESQRAAMASGDNHFDAEFTDHGVSGATAAASRPQFAELLKYARKGDTIHVYAVDRLGRDAIDVQATVRALLGKGVAVSVHGLGVISKGVGELILAVLAQVADMERQRIIERTAAGREAARRSLAENGRTQHGKLSLGRPKKANSAEVIAWRRQQKASISDTAQHFGLSLATVKRYGVASAAAPLENPRLPVRERVRALKSRGETN